MENILQSYFHRSTLEEVDVREVEQLASQYPYLAQAQYLLSKKYLQTGHPHYKKQVAKTALFFNNPHWFHHILNDQLFTKGNFDDSFFAEAAVHPGTSDNNIDRENVSVDVLDDEPFAGEEAEEFQPVAQEPVQDIITEEFNDHATEPEAHEIVATQQQPAYLPPSDTSAVTIAHEQMEISVDRPVYDPGSESIAKEEAENVPAEIASTEPDDIVLEAPPAAEPVTVVAAAEQPGSQQGKINKDDKISGLLSKLPYEKTGTLEGSTAGGIIPIEPLHTIDYFASQGIKLRETEVEGKDKLSIKLRSFTEWLKTMKRIHPEKLEKEEEQQVQSVQHIAEHSNEENDVLTEAMAEVFARQGLHHKAIDVYQKLSLLNPGKRAYFAAKISKLNDN